MCSGTKYLSFESRITTIRESSKDVLLGRPSAFETCLTPAPCICMHGTICALHHPSSIILPSFRHPSSASNLANLGACWASACHITKAKGCRPAGRSYTSISRIDLILLNAKFRSVAILVSYHLGGQEFTW